MSIIFKNYGGFNPHGIMVSIETMCSWHWLIQGWIIYSSNIAGTYALVEIILLNQTDVVLKLADGFSQ